MAKKYPEQIVIGGFTFIKAADELFVELKKEFKKTDVEAFLDENKKAIQWEFKPRDRKMLTLLKFNRASTHGKWLKMGGVRRESVDALSNKLERDKRVRIASPVYTRKDLKIENGFSLDDQIIIRLKDQAPQKELQLFLKKTGLEKVAGPKGELGKGIVLARVRDAKKQNAHEVALKLAESKFIASANVNMIQLHKATMAVPNDTYFADQWNLNNTGQTMADGNVGTAGCDINVEQAWDISKGSPLVVIAILDSGCDLTHPELLPHFVQQDRWYNADTGTTSPDDDIGHGTCCAGIASALTNWLTAQGVAGVGWHCRIMPVRMIWDSGWSISEAAILNALNHALNNNANVISMSWMWDGSQTNIDTALQNCVDAGIVLVAAAGNYAGLYPDALIYPASNQNVIAVGATNENDGRCTNQDWPGWINNGSQYGPELSVMAPGVHTWSTDMQGTGQGYNSVYGGGDAAGDYYEDFGGTSGATPHVAGLAGLILAYNPALTPAQARSIIENTADDLVGDPAEDTSGWDKYMGHGRINAHAALVEVQTNHPSNPADVYVRNSLSDPGTEPYSGSTLCFSPDIIVRKSPVANPQAAFADMTLDPGSDNVEIGNDNYIYVRVHNKGAVNSDIHTRIYCAPLSTTCSPDLWQYVGQLDFYDVPAGTSAVSDALVWEHVPDPGPAGHFCIIASIEGFRDPHPDPAGISSAVQYMQFIRDHNNIAYRNVVFENILPDTTLQLNFLVAGFIGDKDKFDLQIDKMEEVIHPHIFVRVRESMFKDRNIHLENMVEHAEKPVRRFRTFETREGKRSTIRGLVVAGKKAIQLGVRVPGTAKPGEMLRIAVRQVVNDKVIGEFYVEGRIADPKTVRFIADRGGHLVHKANCKGLHKVDRQQWVPFLSLDDARAAGYDLALDCHKNIFTAKQVSHRLARRVLYFLNRFAPAEDLLQFADRKLGKEYFERRYGKESARIKAYSLGKKAATIILDGRMKLGRYTSLGQIETIKGIRAEEFTDLVNSFK